MLVAGCLQHQLGIAMVSVYHNSDLLQSGGVAEQDPRGHHRPCGVSCSLEPGESRQHPCGAGCGDNFCPGQVCACGKVIAGSESTQRRVYCVD